jgi:hypothetical protein
MMAFSSKHLTLANDRSNIPMARIDNEKFMRETFMLATQKSTDPSTSPIGCVIVLAGFVGK